MELRRTNTGWELWLEDRKAIAITVHGTTANENVNYIAGWLPVLAELIKRTG